MTTPSRPFSYEASKCVLQYLPIEHRLNIRLRCPALRTADSVVPLKFNTLQMASGFLRFDHIEYRLSLSVTTCLLVVCNKIKIINRKKRTESELNLTEHHCPSTRRSFLMNKLLGGRRDPVTFENLELNPNYVYSIDMKLDPCLPKDLKMKVNNVEMHLLDEDIIKQFSRHIVGGPLRSFKVIKVRNIRDSAFDCDLLKNAQCLHIPIEKYIVWRFDQWPVFPQKEVAMNTNSSVASIYDGYFLVHNVIRGRQRSTMETLTNMTINTDRRCKDNVLETLRRELLARQAVVDDLENNLFNIPCVCLPMGQNNELNVYGIPGTITKTVLKIRVMPKGSARPNA